MAGPVSTAREIGQTPARTSSIDSAISAISSKSQAQKGSDGQTSEADIAHLIKTAGSPEAVIQYLLKEKNSQSQQNSQLWRLVDKQRAMILGLNKDLERALKDKEKYRKKLKEVMALPGFGKVLGNEGAAGAEQAGVSDPGKLRPNGSEAVRNQSLDTTVPDSPNLDSDSQKLSPTDMSMAPYPITPPADQPNAPSSSTAAVGDILDPAREMPKPEEHALDRYNHEAEEEAADNARKEAQNSQMKDLPINISLPPSRSLPSEPPSDPPPRPPPAPPTTAPPQPPPSEQGLNQFPAPPPRKGPPAPLQIVKGKAQASTSPEEEDSDTDYDDILEMDGVEDERRGRRKTREEDQHEREMAAKQEAERRSLSKKNKSQQSPQPTPEDRGEDSATIPLSPGRAPPPIAVKGDMHPSMDEVVKDLTVPPLGQGLPASPRPFGNMGGARQAVASPPMSPRGVPMANGAPLSPRPPRQPIPLPPNTPLAGASPQSSAAGPPQALNSPKPLNIAKPGPTAAEPASPMTQSRDNPTERTTIFKGFVTDEYPGLLLPPNALLSIEVRVASSRMKPSRASLLSLTQLEEDPVFTLAVFSRADGGELWRVEKDSASLLKLDQRMKKCPAFTAKTPDRALFSGHSPARLDARRVALDQYMDELLNTPLDAETAVELCKYFSTNTLPPNSGETSFSKLDGDTGNLRNGAGGRPLISGYLTKRGKNFGGWKARYFALDGPLLKYYETPGGAHLGTIKLQNAQIGKQAHNPDNQSPARANNSDEDNQYRHAFLILEPKKKDSSSHVKHVLCAESDAERDQWVDTLLQWIDYRDPEDEPSGKRGAQDRQGGSDRQKGQGKKKREHTKSQHGQSNSETLIGVSYDSTTAGEAPQSGTQRPKTGGGSSDRPRTAGGERPKTGIGLPGNPHDTEFQVPTISAPRDPQPISDSATWGTKPGLMPPTVEEKKQRKRSFFGFGPKTRSSSDGQDSLFGSEGASNSTPPQNNEYRGPVRQVFGAPVADAVRFNSPVDVNVPLPAVVYRCIQYLDHRDAIYEEGIFRLSGSNVVIKQLRERFNTEGDVDLVNDSTYYDIHAVASLLKLYLRELPTTILTRDLHLEFLAVTELPSVKEKVAALSELVQRLPQANVTLLMYLIAFLIKIINNSDRNKMTVRNVGIVFSPTLNIPAPVFAMFLQNYESIFGIDPEEYELPSPAPDSDTQSQISGREPGPRPSTAQGTSVSPHRQRLMQSGDASRGTTTPPLLHSLNDARGASTPPPSFPLNRQGSSGYEPPYMNQPQPAQQPQRPAYETGFSVPQGFDPSAFYAPPRNANPGYDRPLYASDSGGSSTGRRESAVFGTGGQSLNSQQSKSRLREETLF
ncbi:hypothetical protein VUR80DRAFT_815 [Thermomyces stellatus]